MFRDEVVRLLLAAIHLNPAQVTRVTLSVRTARDCLQLGQGLAVCIYGATGAAGHARAAAYAGFALLLQAASEHLSVCCAALP